MKAHLVALIAELSIHFLAVGISEVQLASLEADDLDHVGIYDALIVVKRQEVSRYIYAIELVPKSMWDFYEAKGLDLRECRIRKKAEKDLRKAFRSRVSVFVRKKKNDIKEAAPSQAQGEPLRPQSTG